MSRESRAAAAFFLRSATVAIALTALALFAALASQAA